MKNKFAEFNNAIREYHEVFGHELPPLPREPILSDFYTPSNEQHDADLAFITSEHDWNGKSFVVLRTLNYITMCHTIIFTSW